jgi:hypothetical protein
VQSLGGNFLNDFTLKVPLFFMQAVPFFPETADLYG